MEQPYYFTILNKDFHKKIDRLMEEIKVEETLRTADIHPPINEVTLEEAIAIRKKVMAYEYRCMRLSNKFLMFCTAWIRAWVQDKTESGTKITEAERKQVKELTAGHRRMHDKGKVQNDTAQDEADVLENAIDQLYLLELDVEPGSYSRASFAYFNCQNRRTAQELDVSKGNIDWIDQYFARVDDE